MAQGILTLNRMPTNPVANPVYVSAADAAADVVGIDLEVADLWYIQAKISVKASNNSVGVALFLSDDALGLTNPQYITPLWTLAAAGVSIIIVRGIGNKTQRYLNIDVTLGGTATFDYEIFATPVAA